MIIAVAGTRPQLLKASVMGYPILHTGQHWDYEMSDLFMEELGFDVMSTLGARTSDVMTISNLIYEWIGRTVINVEGFIAIGDTNTALATAQVAKAMNLHLIHQEAGARCWLPTIEEANRVLIDNMADERWAASENSCRNLEDEGLSYEYRGDPMLSMFLKWRERAKPIKGLEPKRYCLLTMHRQENVRDPKKMETILNRVKDMSDHLPIVWPMHPRIDSSHGFKEIQPVGYLEMLWLTQNAHHVFTDSGGVEREAMWAGTPLTVLRPQTEWGHTDRFKEFCGAS